MFKKLIGLMLVALGVVVMVVSLAADVIGIGSYPGINYVQIAGAAAGAILALGGIWLMAAKGKRKRTMGGVLIALGLFVLVVSLAADVIWIGTPVGFGPLQISGAAAGVVVALVGLLLVRRKKSESKKSEVKEDEKK